MDPSTSMAIEGGTVSPITAEAASTAAPSASEMCSFCSISRITVPTAATSATFAPDRPETRYMLPTITWSRPPRQCPTRACTSWTSLRLIPPRSMISPAKMKNGTASSTKLLVPFTMFCGSASKGAALVPQR